MCELLYEILGCIKTYSINFLIPEEKDEQNGFVFRSFLFFPHPRIKTQNGSCWKLIASVSFYSESVLGPRLHSSLLDFSASVALVVSSPTIRLLEWFAFAFVPYKTIIRRANCEQEQVVYVCTMGLEIALTGVFTEHFLVLANLWQLYSFFFLGHRRSLDL